MATKRTKPVVQELEQEEDWEDATVRRHKIVDEVLEDSFQLNGVGTIFQVGQECRPTFKDVCYVLNRLWVLGFAEQYNLLPEGVPVEILGGGTPLTEKEKEAGKRARPGALGVTKAVADWLVPTILQDIERKVFTGRIDILAPNNRSLVYLAHILGWYWHTELSGPKPVHNKLLNSTRPQIVQDTAICCPACFHQFVPPKNLVTMRARMYAFARWLPGHLEEYHRWPKPGSAKKAAKTRK